MYPKRLYRRKAQLDSWWCQWCDKEFQRIRSDARFCSARCRKAFQRSSEGALARLKRLGKITTAIGQRRPKMQSTERVAPSTWRAIHAVRVQMRNGRSPQEAVQFVLANGKPPRQFRALAETFFQKPARD
jgi:hypothetical protein